MGLEYQNDISAISNVLNYFSDIPTATAKALAQLLNTSQSVIKTDDELLDKLQLLEDLNEVELQKNAFLVIILDNLINSIEAYQSTDVHSPNQVLLHLIKQNQTKQKELSYIVPQSIISELVNGKRQLTIRHIKAFAKHFNVPMTYFLK
ncbi:helix-turn-helix domain-containing protein [Catenovulum adriaticum]|uniref:Helix-turn-helix domain-containing protein n=1 Tax=Catenovulum adriaticum TaxID=2984846 RepID=A0ABY7APL6_9ALTE|nr:helix-turn-helix domain-containing protein [Catenovulum sp. TS8]WAJ70249.1 helix-turn-helix domain-containing protein [Catenovulum sp. TS8]